MVDHDSINQRRIVRLAKEHRCSVAEINRALSNHPVLVDNKSYLGRVLAAQLVEVDALNETFHAKAIEERDTAAGMLCVKIHERVSTLLGLNAPQSAAVQIIEHERPQQPDATSPRWLPRLG